MVSETFLSLSVCRCCPTQRKTQTVFHAEGWRGLSSCDLNYAEVKIIPSKAMFLDLGHVRDLMKIQARNRAPISRGQQTYTLEIVVVYTVLVKPSHEITADVKLPVQQDGHAQFLETRSP
jgi:hypothetical protein